MGVSIYLEGRKSITPGFRSMMADLFAEHFPASFPSDGVVRYYLFPGDLAALREIAITQRKGEIDAPGDYDVKITQACGHIRDRIRTKGETYVDMCY